MKYIETDIENGLSYLKVAIHNIIFSLTSRELKYYTLNINISIDLLYYLIRDVTGHTLSSISRYDNKFTIFTDEGPIEVRKEEDKIVFILH